MRFRSDIARLFLVVILVLTLAFVLAKYVPAPRGCYPEFSDVHSPECECMYFPDGDACQKIKQAAPTKRGTMP